jgi:hypothetical protein
MPQLQAKQANRLLTSRCSTVPKRTLEPATSKVRASREPRGSRLSHANVFARFQHLPDAWALQRQLPGQIHLRSPAVSRMLVLEREAI